MLSQTKARNTRGFTLIELLVVIAVIATLMSILMPSLRKAKEQSRQTVCMTRLHNLFLGWEVYSQENKYMVCPPFTGGADGNFVKGWVDDGIEDSGNFKGGSEYAIRDGLLWSQIEDIEVYKCPSDKSKRLRSYALSFAMGGGQGSSPAGGYISSRDGIKPVSRAPKTSGKLVFIDSEPSCPCSNRWIAGSFIPLKANIGEWVKMSTRSDITNRHDNGCNAVFADGSAVPWKWQDLETIEFANNKSILSQPAGLNKDYRMIKHSMQNLR